MASTTTSIPRFLLPQSGLIWRRAAPIPTSASAPGRIFLRLASTKPNPPPGGRVLAKPERFNPPSHGARLPKNTPPRHYGGELSYEEASAQAVRDYPGMAPPEHTMAHRILHNRWIHVVITVGTLTTLAIFTFTLSFQKTSPFADMLPSRSDFLRQPLASTRMVIEVVRLHEAHKTARINEKRRRNVDDVAKRAAYRKAHGLPDEMGLFNQPMARIRSDEGADAADVAVEGGRGGGEGVVAAAAAAAAAESSGAKKDGEHDVRRLSEKERQAVVEKAKKGWMGIF
ncbi:hypothetical protein CHGG_07890 [Chaetomium globosum CBS 148.51]|uniref:Uncharacterized protein n=1 Tax=Chaetomium globosum (strain ATCC 6205 / CBS 148.51 / DSM 1962 / NBRC 6347 / NRRL 1970) TaxID=306901 RepID=Q2GVW4_CHAGB|nr:uncharacterized protein CHGG_07890 [Chaetomium globosum CBS 148.51]EAQ86637.1 hypothetical protein CHGG_07890 [Chaetomium globosum CBS 148.51]